MAIRPLLTMRQPCWRGPRTMGRTSASIQLGWRSRVAAREQPWRRYLAGESVPADAVPARADELTGVASTLITCSELDPLRDEAIDYALRLMWAGVTTELHVFPGTCHGFDSLLPEWEISQQLFELQGAALRRALHHIASSRAMAAW